jgi:hypothetical protein
MSLLEVPGLAITKVSDAILSHRKGLKRLNEVFVLQTTVTHAGWKKLKEALPKQVW